MKKSYNLIPGERIENVELVNTIKQLISTVDIKDWIVLDEDSYLSYLSYFNNCYVLYLDPKGIIIRLYKVEYKELSSFLKNNSSPIYGYGIDIAVCPLSIDNAVIFNHDGEAFLLRALLNYSDHQPN